MEHFRGLLRFLQQHKRNLDTSVMEGTRKRREKRRMTMRDSYCLLCYTGESYADQEPDRDHIRARGINPAAESLEGKARLRSTGMIASGEH
jgi:hypothetical protein